MATRTLQVNGADLTFQDEGTGVPVVLLHGMLGDYRTWARQVARLALSYRVVALSQRYYWPNPWPDDGAGFGVAAHAADAAALARQLDLPPVHLLGHSYGGAVAARVALDHPGLVRTLILGEPALASLAADDPEAPELLAEFAKARQAAYTAGQSGDMATSVNRYLEFVFGIDPLNRIRDEHYRVMVENGAAHCAAYRPRPAPPPFTPEDARALTMPVLLIQGGATRRLFQIICDRLAEHLPEVERAMLPGVSHALQMEAPDAFNETVRRFLASH